MKELLSAAFVRQFFRLGVCLILLPLAFLSRAYGGFLYVYNDTGNSIYGYSVNERTGALTPLAGFPVLAGGTGGGVLSVPELMNIDPVNNRLYVVSDGSDRVNAYSINTTTGALTALPFSPIQLPAAGRYTSVKVNPSGSLIAVNDSENSITHTYVITPTAATFSQSLSSVNTPAVSDTVFSRDGNYFYRTGGVGIFFSGYNVNPTTGFMTEMIASPFSPPTGIAPFTDSQGRIFGILNSTPPYARVFTTNQGAATLVHERLMGGGGPFIDAALHPNETVLAATAQNRVFAMRIDGTGANTTLQIGGDSVSEGNSTNALAFNQAGNFLFAINALSNNISTFRFFGQTAGVTLNNFQPTGANGSGYTPGIAYLPTGIPVFVSGRVTDANGRPISGARITATSTTPASTQTAVTNPFGYYTFDELIMDRAYTFEIRQKQFTFAPQTFTPNQEFNELNFTASP